ncbi:hypothetical protein ACFZBU_01750 [Embleya sp. NPDC008237]|uniref:hypothetical protein n=1 Tax=Embleya sp. NPDC008237 TaxID=3363978 RepID=UPI0036EEF2D4
MGSPRSEEQELAAAMRTAASELVLPAGLVAGGITRGRRMRRARRIRVGASAAAVLAVVGTGLVVAGGTDGKPGSRDASGAAAVAGNSISPSTSPGPNSGFGAPIGKEAVSAQEIARILMGIQWAAGKQVEPKGGSFVPKPGDSASRVGASASILLTSPAGSIRLSVQVMSSAPTSSAPDSSGTDCVEIVKTGGTCRPFIEPDGTHGHVGDSRPGPGSTIGGSGRAESGTSGPWSRFVRLTRPDGVEISVTAAGVTQNPMPLTLDELKQVALWSDWQLWVTPEVNRAARAKVTGFQDQSASPSPNTLRTRVPQTLVPPAVPTGSPVESR